MHKSENNNVETSLIYTHFKLAGHNFLEGYMHIIYYQCLFWLNIFRDIFIL